MQLGINLVNGNWVIVNGKVELANYLLTKIQLIFSIQKGKWLYDITFGSDIPQITTQRANITSEQLKQLLIDALNPLIKNNEIQDNVTIVCTFDNIGIFKFDINCTDITGNYFKFNYTVGN